MNISVGDTIQLVKDEQITTCTIMRIGSSGIMLASESPIACSVGEEEMLLDRFWLRGSPMLVEPETKLRSAVYHW